MQHPRPQREASLAAHARTRVVLSCVLTVKVLRHTYLELGKRLAETSERALVVQPLDLNRVLVILSTLLRDVPTCGLVLVEAPQPVPPALIGMRGCSSLCRRHGALHSFDEGS